MRLMSGAAAVAAAIAFYADVAQAQPTAAAKDDDTGLFCVYDALAEAGDYKLVAQVYLVDGLGKDIVDEASQILRDAANDCRERYILSDDRVESMSNMAVLGSSIDYLSEKLRADGVSRKAIDGLFNVYDDLGDDDLDALFESDWRSDAAFAGKLRRSLVGAGVPDKDTAIEAAFSILELSAMADEEIYAFLVDDLGSDEDS